MFETYISSDCLNNFSAIGISGPFKINNLIEPLNSVQGNSESFSMLKFAFANRGNFASLRLVYRL